MRPTSIAIALTCVVGCSVPDYTFTGTEPVPVPDVAGSGNPLEYDTAVADISSSSDTGCKGSADCASSSTTPHCNAITGSCVQCLENEHCAKDQWCSNGACVTGCRDDRDCAVATSTDAGVDDAAVTVTKCDPVAHVCAGCKTDPDCPAGYLCKSDGVCRAGCTEAHACTTGNECCSGSCTDTTRDLDNCGACGTACAPQANTTIGCAPDTSGRGACTVDACAPGWGDCNRLSVDGCETNLNTLANCGGCGTACTIANGTGVCDAGTCKVATCGAGYGDCDGKAENGCEQALATLTHCGACGTTCALANATSDCSTGTCKVASCNSGFGNCDGAHANGCEINFATSTSHCGSCGNACPTGSGAPSCVSGVCKYSTCSSGLGDCTGDGSCSTTLTNNVNHCGACGNACVTPHATPTCSGSTCSMGACAAGWGNCNGNIVDGCEQKLDNIANCGACGSGCVRANAIPTCSTGTCQVSACQPGFANCDAADANGCEISLLTDVNNCGACSNTCTIANGTAKCSGGGCAVNTCNAGYGNCNSSSGDGCEQKLDTLAHCGTCGSACSLSNATATCGTGSCKVASCNANYGNCDGADANGCEKPLAADVNNCGSCGRVCSTTNGTSKCTSGACGVATCNAGYADCDGNPASCERNLAAAINSCTTTETIFTSGGSDICGYGTGNSASITTTGTKYFRTYLMGTGCAGTACNTTSNPVRARYTLTNPPGVAYDLRVYTTSACSVLVGSSTSGVLGGTETVKLDTKSCINDGYYIEVKYRAGSSCSATTLSVVGAYTPYP